MTTDKGETMNDARPIASFARAIEDAAAKVRYPDEGAPEYDADCPACLRARPHTQREHERAIDRARS